MEGQNFIQKKENQKFRAKLKWVKCCCQNQQEVLVKTIMQPFWNELLKGGMRNKNGSLFEMTLMVM